MIHGSWITFLIDDSVSNTLSEECDLGRVYETVIIQIPTIETATLTARGAMNTGDTAVDLYTTDPADGQNTKLITASGEGALAWIVPIGGYQYIRLFSNADQVSDKTFYARGIRS